MLSPKSRETEGNPGHQCGLAGCRKPRASTMASPKSCPPPARRPGKVCSPLRPGERGAPQVGGVAPQRGEAKGVEKAVQVRNGQQPKRNLICMTGLWEGSNFHVIHLMGRLCAVSPAPAPRRTAGTARHTTRTMNVVRRFGHGGPGAGDERPGTTLLRASVDSCRNGARSGVTGAWKRTAPMTWTWTTYVRCPSVARTWTTTCSRSVGAATSSRRRRSSVRGGRAGGCRGQ